jgi:hypothetical protein
MQWFKIHAQRWFLGSTRFELSPEQRAVWIDVLARASLNDPAGEFEYYSLEQLAAQFQVSLALVKNSLKRFVEVKKIAHDPKKKSIKILNWGKYQSEYERQKPYRKKQDCNQVTGKGVTKLSLDKIREEEIREEGEGDESKEKESILPPIPKNLSFEIQDKLKSMRAVIRKLEREYQDKDYLRKAGINEEEMLNKITRLQKEYCTAIEDYSD